MVCCLDNNLICTSVFLVYTSKCWFENDQQSFFLAVAMIQSVTPFIKSCHLSVYLQLVVIF